MRDSNPRLSEYESDALPLSYSIVRVGSPRRDARNHNAGDPSVRTTISLPRARVGSARRDRPRKSMSVVAETTKAAPAGGLERRCRYCFRASCGPGLLRDDCVSRRHWKNHSTYARPTVKIFFVRRARSAQGESCARSGRQHDARACEPICEHRRNLAKVSMVLASPAFLTRGCRRSRRGSPSKWTGCARMREALTPR